jgi:galactitol-specific phosphotransferase system IIB component
VIVSLYLSQKVEEVKEEPGLDAENDVRDLRMKKWKQKRKGADILVGQQRQS